MSKHLGDELTLIEMMQRFSTEELAREYFERLRWPDGPVCAHCGNSDRARIYKVTPNPAEEDKGRALQVRRMRGRLHRDHKYGHGGFAHPA